MAALRLTEKGYRVGVLEAGWRYTNDTLPATSWDLRRFLWAPKLGLRGIQRISLLNDVLVLSGAGVGGGSLVYANTLHEPAPDDQARRMLGVVTNPTPADRAMETIAEEMGAAGTFGRTPVGVFFGEPGEATDDPYFGGAGPPRAGCLQCGECMTGCRHNAKNRLDLTYLHLAERGGAVVRSETTVTAVRPLADGGYAVDTERTGRGVGHPAAAARPARRGGAAVGLGAPWRADAHELGAIVGATARHRRVDYTQGVAITSWWHPDEHTDIEPVRYARAATRWDCCRRS